MRPSPGPDGLLWLLTQGGSLLGLDPVLGDRRVDQPKAAGEYEVFGGWPGLVRRRDAVPRVIVSVSAARGRAVTAIDGRKIGSAALPKDLGKAAAVQLGDGVAWLYQRHHPSRGTPSTRFASFDLEAQAFGPVHSLASVITEFAASGRRLALFDEAAGRAHVYEHDALLCSVQLVSARWGCVALEGDEIALVSHQRGSRPGAVASVGWAALRRSADPIPIRRFTLHTQGATYVTFVGSLLAIHQYSDVTLVAREALHAARDVELTLEIEDLATPAPRAAHTARVAYVGATTGFGFVESDTLGRLRFQFDVEHPPAAGDMIALDDVEAGAVRKWHPFGCGPRPLDPASRCLSPAPSSDFESLVPRAAMTSSGPVVPVDAACPDRRVRPRSRS